MDSERRKRPARGRNGYVVASFWLGFGIGGFLDGIILHQLLQWHNMIANVLPPDTLERLRTNVFADGLFNMAMLAVTAVGLALLWRTVKRGDTPLIATRTFIGWIGVGWGVFHLFDTVVFHALLGLHHIRQVPNFLIYDIVFCTLGIALIAVGMGLARTRKTEVQ